MASPVPSGSNSARSVIAMLMPLHFSPLNLLESGVNSMGTKLTPRRPWAESSAASFWPSSHGAPSTSNGVSVPRPTERLVVSKRSEERRVGKGGRNGMGGDDERQ